MRIPIRDDELRSLQATLLSNPRIGDQVKKTAGVRKLRLAVKGRGKRGGARILYYYVTRRRTIYLLMAYDKTVSEDLTSRQRRYLAQLAAQLEVEGED